jgi:hypothetical protein
LRISWGCKCKTTGGTAAQCNSEDKYDCSEAEGEKYYLAMLYTWWETGMWAIGGTGFGVALFLIAIPAFAASVSSGSGTVVAFSLCSGLFWGPYMFIGACFMTVAAAFRCMLVSFFPRCATGV